MLPKWFRDIEVVNLRRATLQGRVEEGQECFRKALAAQARCGNAEGPSPGGDAEDDWETGEGLLPLPDL